VAHSELSDNFTIPESKIAIAVNSVLPYSIRISGVKIIDGDFHARFSAVAREYIYRLTTTESVFNRHFVTYYKYPINFPLLQDSSEVFCGRHDFTSFSKHNPSTLNYECNVELCSWDRPSESEYRLRIRADRFVYGMVRALTGAMLTRQRGKVTQEYLRSALEARDRSLGLQLAPPEGLTLERVYYSTELFPEIRHSL
jgi:tRNA pseudouridine38-40 synthase